MRSKYHSVHYTFNASDPLRREELSPTHWPLERFKDVIAMKEEALRVAREIWADHVFVSFENKTIQGCTVAAKIIESP